MAETSNPTDRWLAACGVVAPVLFVVIVSSFGLVEPGYSHCTQMMSVLGGVEGARGLVFNLALGLVGMSLIAFAVGLRRGLTAGRRPWGTPLLVVLGGAGLLGSAVFHCSTGCTNVLQAPTLFGRLHLVFSLIGGMGLGLAPLFAIRALRGRPRWAAFALIMGILANVPGLVLWGSLLTTRMPQWEGVIQRLGIAFPLMWIEIMALRLMRSSPIVDELNR